jgi:hypothetical protein
VTTPRLMKATNRRRGLSRYIFIFKFLCFPVVKITFSRHWHSFQSESQFGEIELLARLMIDSLTEINTQRL